MGRILIIDDEAEIRTALREMLQRAGHEVIEAEDGKVGVVLYRKSPVDLVITDLFMPEQEGLRTMAILKREDLNVKMIAISGGGVLGSTDMLSVAEQFGASYTFAKPFCLDDMLNAVNRLLDSTA